MPGRILTESERERWEQFPAEITSEDVVTYFTLSPHQTNLWGHTVPSVGNGSHAS